MSQQEANKKIIQELSKAVDKYPDIRFHQLLYNLNIQISVPELDENGIFDKYWRCYAGSSTFKDGEKVVKWRYCKDCC